MPLPLITAKPFAKYGGKKKGGKGGKGGKK